MDIVVYLALAVLAAVFLFSLFMLIVMCHRRHEYNRLLMAHSLRFSKLHQDNLDDVIQLGPHLSQKLNNNQWVEEVSGILQNCVAVLKLSHLLTDNMSKISLNQISPQLNELICQGTTRVVPRFDILLRSMAAKNVDIRVIEARVSALVTACWSLVTPFYMLSPKYKDSLGAIVKEMELYHAQLLLALEQVEQANPTTSPSSVGPTAATSLSTVERRDADVANGVIATNLTDGSVDGVPNNMVTVLPDAPYGQTAPSETAPFFVATTPLIKRTVERDSHVSSLLRNGDCIKLRLADANDATKELLRDEAPADPSSS